MYNLDCAMLEVLDEEIERIRSSKHDQVNLKLCSEKIEEAIRALERDVRKDPNPNGMAARLIRVLKTRLAQINEENVR